MKTILILALMFSSMSVFAGGQEMKELVDITDGSLSVGHMPEGYTAIQVNKVPVKGKFRDFLKKTNRQKIRDWKDYVYNSGEYERATPAEKSEIAANPRAELGVSLLLEISEVYAIYKGKIFIGYSVEVLDHVQAAIYQDGAWYEILLDEELNIIQLSEESA